MGTNSGGRAATLEEMLRLVKTAAHELDRAVVEHLEGISVAQWHVLAALEGGTGKPMSALGSATLLPGPSLTRLIDGMVDDNLVLRKPDVVDRRRVLVYQTRRGASLHQRIRARLAKFDDAAAVLGGNTVLAERLPELLARLDARAVDTRRQDLSAAARRS
jgi:DNA-binding MarR family transcriptional regulator